MKWSVYARAVLAVLVLGALAADPVSAQITTGTVAGSVKSCQARAVSRQKIFLMADR